MIYRTIVADPPWRYDDGFVSMRGPRSLRQVRERIPTQKRVESGLPYEAMSVEEICSLPVSDLAAPNAHLFLWTTNRYLRAAFEVLDAWEFAYTQTIVWVKDRRSPFVASVAPNHTEYLLVSRRGDLAWSSSLKSNVVEAGGNPKWRRHSTKPEVFLDLIEQVSPGPYVELFARRNRFGWDTWGNEALDLIGGIK